MRVHRANPRMVLTELALVVILFHHILRLPTNGPVKSSRIALGKLPDRPFFVYMPTWPELQFGDSAQVIA